MADERPVTVTPAISRDDIKKLSKISEDFYTVYVNHSRIAASQNEMRIFFGENYPTATGELIVTENLSVVMTPQNIKAMATLLQQIVTTYEESFGEIPAPANFPDSLATLSKAKT